MSELLTFFMIFIRTTTVCSVAPWIGDLVVPVPLKVLFSFFFSFFIYPILRSTQAVDPHQAIQWSDSADGIIKVLISEIFLGLILGFVSQFVFYGIQFGSNLIGNFMGFSAASTYDPHQESHTQLVSQFQFGLVFLLFLSLDGHHLFLKSLVKTYSLVSLGEFSFSLFFSENLIRLSSDIFTIGLHISAPVAVSTFFVNAVFGLLCKAIPQVNIFSLSLGVSAGVGLFILLTWTPLFHSYLSELFPQMEHSLFLILKSLKGGSS